MVFTKNRKNTWTRDEIGYCFVFFTYRPYSHSYFSFPQTPTCTAIPPQHQLTRQVQDSELFSDELLKNNNKKAWGTGHRSINKEGKSEGKQRGGLETEDLFWSAPHHYHRPSDTISAALRSPALQTPLCVCLCQPSSFHCYATHMHAHSPLKTTHAVERIIRLLNHTSQIHHGSVTVGSVGVKERRKFCHLSVLSSAAHYGTAPFSARTYLCVRIFLCKTFSIISINGLDVPSFISNFFFSPEAFDIQPVDIKNSGLNFSPSFFVSVSCGAVSQHRGSYLIRCADTASGNLSVFSN